MMIGEHGQWLDPHPDGQLWDRPLAERLKTTFAGHSVLDMGCGLGWYMRVWRAAGIDVDGVDGSPTVLDLGLGCLQVDLAEPITLPRLYDWVFCLEVGEHIPGLCAGVFLDNVARHAGIGVVLSWAVPGQAGHGHVNCQPNEWVIRRMADRGFSVDHETSADLRAVCELDYLRNTLMVFRKVSLTTEPRSGKLQ